MIIVTAAILIKENKVLIAKRKSGDNLEGKWELPGGKLEDDESLEECLIREINEELGVKISIVTYFGSTVYDYSNQSIKLEAFLVRHLDGDFKLNSHDEIQFVKPSELNNFNYAPADIPLIIKIKRYLLDGSF